MVFDIDSEATLTASTSEIQVISKTDSNSGICITNLWQRVEPECWQMMWFGVFFSVFYLLSEWFHPLALIIHKKKSMQKAKVRKGK